MKRDIRLILLGMCALLLLSSCSLFGNKTDLHHFLLKKAIDLTCEMDGLAESEEYLALLGNSPLTSGIFEDMAAPDYDLPDSACVISIAEGALLKAMFGPDSVSGPLAEKLKSRINGTVFANMINASYGAGVLAATSGVTWAQSYLQPQGWEDDVLLFLEYPGRFSSMVSFSKSGDGVVTALATFVKNGDQDLLEILGDWFDTGDLEYETYAKEDLETILR